MTQPCLSYTAALDQYTASLSPLEGFHYFITGEYACVKEFAWICVETELCNSVRPDDDTEMTAWLMQPLFAEYAQPDPPIVYCNYYDEEVLNFEFIPRFITNNIICDIRVKTEIKTDTCNKLYEGGIYCNNYNMERLSSSDCSAEEVESAWTIFNYGNELLMLRDDLVDLWWDLGSDYPEKFTMDGYEWQAAVDLHSKRYWLFEFNDIAWQYHGDENRVEMQLAFRCIDEAACQSVSPVTDLYEKAWLLLPMIPNNITVPYLPLVDCQEIWVEGYPYVEQSALCGLEDGIREVHICRDPVQCSRIAPDYHDTMLQHHVWHLNTEVRGILIADVVPEEATCSDFK